MAFTILPAIDLKDGRCVRLRQGRADDVTVYAADPVDMARRLAAEGAEYLHVVDLDGAFQGRPVHGAVIAAIARAIAIPLEVGGGLRGEDDVQAVLDAGAARAILGTRALRDPAGMGGLAARFGERLAVGIDARDGRVQVRGWTETTGVRATELAARLSGLGVRTLIYTDTATDGMLQGPNTDGLRAVAEAAACDVIASGGVASADDVVRIRALGMPNITGAIVGKALYEQRVSVAELRAAAARPAP